MLANFLKIIKHHKVMMIGKLQKFLKIIKRYTIQYLLKFLKVDKFLKIRACGRFLVLT